MPSYYVGSKHYQTLSGKLLAEPQAVGMGEASVLLEPGGLGADRPHAVDQHQSHVKISSWLNLIWDPILFIFASARICSLKPWLLGVKSNSKIYQEN